MEWKLFADLAEIGGGRHVEVEVDETEPTVDDALDALLAAHPDLEDRILDEDGALRDHINILCNGENIHNLNGLDTPIESDTELALFPPVSGG